MTAGILVSTDRYRIWVFTEGRYYTVNFVYMSVLHITNWYPNPWDSIEGNFIHDQIRVFRKEVPGAVVAVQVRSGHNGHPRIARPTLPDGARGYFLLAQLGSGKLAEFVSTLLLIGVLLRERAWRYKALHFHVAYPLLVHSGLWRKLIGRPIIISEHWSAYHYNFYLPPNSRALRNLRSPFQKKYPVLTVSEALLADIREFARNRDFPAFVIPNVVPLHGVETKRTAPDVPVFFTVNRWTAIKNPMPMLAGLSQAAEAGQLFTLVIGGFGPLIEEMKAFVESSVLRGRTQFVGKMTKEQIAAQLAESDGYLFSSKYETFSVACAEALGAGVPLVGPFIPAIAEYAGNTEWEQVADRGETAWKSAIGEFLNKHVESSWNRTAIAERAAQRFSEATIRKKYRDAMAELGFLDER